MTLGDSATLWQVLGPEELSTAQWLTCTAQLMQALEI